MFWGSTKSSGVPATDPQYGKKLFEDRFGQRYYTFDHKGHHFVVLDSIYITEDNAYEGRIDDAQLKWLAGDLAAIPSGTPVIVSVHIPLVSAYASYLPEPATPAPHHSLTVANANQVLDLFEGHNVLGVLQGHTHINERWNGEMFLTSPEGGVRELVERRPPGHTGGFYRGDGGQWNDDDPL